jgi:hypothetical protein
VQASEAAKEVLGEISPHLFDAEEWAEEVEAEEATPASGARV